jgi:hypothetical protein
VVIREGWLRAWLETLGVCERVVGVKAACEIECVCVKRKGSSLVFLLDSMSMRFSSMQCMHAIYVKTPWPSPIPKCYCVVSCNVPNFVYAHNYLAQRLLDGPQLVVANL